MVRAFNAFVVFLAFLFVGFRAGVEVFVYTQFNPGVKTWMENWPINPWDLCPILPLTRAEAFGLWAGILAACLVAYLGARAAEAVLRGRNLFSAVIFTVGGAGLLILGTLLLVMLWVHPDPGQWQRLWLAPASSIWTGAVLLLFLRR